MAEPAVRSGPTREARPARGEGGWDERPTGRRRMPPARADVRVSAPRPRLLGGSPWFRWRVSGGLRPRFDSLRGATQAWIGAARGTRVGPSALRGAGRVSVERSGGSGIHGGDI